MELMLGLCLLYAGLTEADWRPVRAEIAAAKLPPRAVLKEHIAVNAAYQKEVQKHLLDRPGARQILEDCQERQYFLNYAEAAYENANPWDRLYWLHQVRDCVGDGAFYNGGWPNPIPIGALPWYDGPRHREGGQ